MGGLDSRNIGQWDGDCHSILIIKHQLINDIVAEGEQQKVGSDANQQKKRRCRNKTKNRRNRRPSGIYSMKRRDVKAEKPIEGRVNKAEQPKEKDERK